MLDQTNTLKSPLKATERPRLIRHQSRAVAARATIIGFKFSRISILHFCFLG